MTVYMVDSTQYASPSTMLIPSGENIIVAQNASLAFKKSYPSASGSINSRIVTNTDMNNDGERHVYGIAETLAALVTASA